MTEPEAQFRELVASIARSMQTFAAVEEREDELAVEIRREADDDTTFVAYLTNLFAETRELSPVDRAARVREFLDGVADPPDDDLDWDEAEERVFVVVRAPAMFASLPAESPVVARRPLPCLFECVALDLGRTFTYVTRRQLERWERSEDELFDRARANVEERLGHAIEPWDVAAPYPMWHVSEGDAYESSRLLVPSFLRAMARHVTGRVVCAVPERGTLLVVGDASHAAVVRLAETAEREYAASTRGVSPALYAADEEGRVEPYVLDDDHPLAAVVRRGHVLLANAEYAEQKRVLDDAHEAADEDVFVASYIATQRDAEIRTICTWSEKVDTLLPVTDLVAFVKVDGDDEPTDSLLVPWPKVVEIAGDHLELVPDLWPERWHTKSYPDADAYERLRAFAIPEDTGSE